MKNSLSTLLLLLLFIPGFSQNSRYEYNGRFSPAIKKEKLTEARLISEIMPGFCGYFALPFKESARMNDLLKVVALVEGNYAYPPGNYVHTQKNFESIIDYVAIEISVNSQGKVVSSQSTSNVLTAEQKNILNVADLGSDIHIKIKFNYKKWTSNNFEMDSKIKEGEYLVTVVPATEAEYPGGFKQLTEYLNKNVFNKLSGKSTFEKIQQAIVKFTVNEDGQVLDAKFSKTSTDPQIDKLVLEAINKMPKWKPAKNSSGIKVKQEFSIPLDGGRGGC
jgi:TonB family protein